MIKKNTLFLLLCVGINVYGVEVEPDLQVVKNFFENKVIKWDSDRVVLRTSNLHGFPELSSLELQPFMQEQFEKFFNEVGYHDEQYKVLCVLFCKMNEGFPFSLTKKERKCVEAWPEPIRLIINIYVEKKSSCEIS